MCRDKNDPNHRRCPSSFGELRNARDRANYRSKSAASKTSAPDPSVTVVKDVLIPISLEGAAASVREDLHSMYHRRVGANLGYSQYDDETGEGAVTLTWEEAEENVRNVGAAVEDRANKIAGFTPEEAAERYNARVQSVKDNIEPLNSVIDKAKDDLREALQEINRLDAEDPYGDHSELEARIDELKMIRDEAQMEATTTALGLAAEAGFTNVRPEDANTYLRMIQQGTDPATLADMKTLADARLTALGEVRDMGGLTIETNDNSSKRVAAVMEEVANYYPTDWIQKSNDLGNLKVKDTKGRAHYSSRRAQKVRKPMNERTWTEGGEPPEGEGWTKAVYTGNGWADPALSDEGLAEKYADYADKEPDRKMWVRPAMKIRRAREYYRGESVTGDPPRGWTEAYIENDAGDIIRVFQQPMYRMTTGEVVAELTVDRDKPEAQWQETKGFDTAIHEFAHRAEHVNPLIYQLEETFLKRRTTNADGGREKLQRLYYRGNEVGRLDSFAHKYMGKEYPDNYREVMSTGMQALFSGAFGNLADTNGETPDADMRAFILGVLASA